MPDSHTVALFFWFSENFFRCTQFQLASADRYGASSLVGDTTSLSTELSIPSNGGRWMSGLDPYQAHVSSILGETVPERMRQFRRT